MFPIIVFSFETKLLSSESFIEIVAPDNPFQHNHLHHPLRISFNPLDENAPKDCPAEPLKFNVRKFSSNFS